MLDEQRPCQGANGPRDYGADAILSGATPVYVPLHPPHYDFDPAELRRAFASGLKAFVLCKPSNSCGKVFTSVRKHCTPRVSACSSWRGTLRAPR